MRTMRNLTRILDVTNGQPASQDRRCILHRLTNSAPQTGLLAKTAFRGSDAMLGVSGHLSAPFAASVYCRRPCNMFLGVCFVVSENSVAVAVTPPHRVPDHGL